jgi:hypothetical protein
MCTFDSFGRAENALHRRNPHSSDGKHSTVLSLQQYVSDYPANFVVRNCDAQEISPELEPMESSSNVSTPQSLTPSLQNTNIPTPLDLLQQNAQTNEATHLTAANEVAQGRRRAASISNWPPTANL